MSLADLTFDRWCELDPDTARSHAHEAARRAGGRLARFDGTPRPGVLPHRVVIERAGERFALVPGGPVTVGFDLDAWQPLPGQLLSYREESLAGGFGFDEDLRTHLAEVLSPRRTVTVPTVLMAVEPRKLPELPGLVPALLAEEGLRLPSPDEWEHACGAGAATLFRWGDDLPAGCSPWGDTAGCHQQPNVFGLHIAFDVYASAEMTSSPDSVYGGDGGEAVCGGYGTFLEWLPLATSHHNPSTAEFLNGPEGDDAYEDFNARPVIGLG